MSAWTGAENLTADIRSVDLPTGGNSLKRLVLYQAIQEWIYYNNSAG
jgi:hypothetical protein